MPIELKLKQTVEDFLKRARSEISRVGGNINGNEDSGEFSVPLRSGNITGTYELQENNLTIDITDKPSNVTLHRIESELRRYLG